MDLANLREQIDQIDTKIVELYTERMEVCKKVGLEKAKNNNSVALYIGCLTIPYKPESITFCPSSTFTVLER